MSIVRLEDVPCTTCGLRHVVWIDGRVAGVCQLGRDGLERLDAHRTAQRQAQLAVGAR